MTVYLQIFIKCLMKYLKQTCCAGASNIQALMIVPDQEKSFRRNWNFLFNAIQYFGYGSEITQQIKTVYRNKQTPVKVNRHLPQIFSVKRGLWQGCPLSMILYIVFADIFLENIRQNNGIKGTLIDKKELKTSVFANNTTIYIGTALQHISKHI